MIKSGSSSMVWDDGIPEVSSLSVAWTLSCLWKQVLGGTR